jgi:hypothetical protein
LVSRGTATRPPPYALFDSALRQVTFFRVAYDAAAAAAKIRSAGLPGSLAARVELGI